MSDRLVNTCTLILRTLPPSGENVSMIIEQTSSDRSHVITAIAELHKAKLVSREKNPKHRQGIIVKPTELGLELKKLMQDIANYNESFLKFERSVDLNIMPNRGIKVTELEDGREVGHETVPIIDRLRKKNWTSYEIDNFVKWADGTDFAIDTFYKNIFISLLFKYAIIFYSHKTNEKAQRILRKIIID
jgi:DNA-binding MarR family transcriptional regulator